MNSTPFDTQAVVDGHDLGKCFGDRWLVRHSKLRVMPGESVALLGESGAGKSTILNLVSGLEPLDEGQLEVAGHRLESLQFDPDATAALRREHIGFVFQAFHLLPHLTVVQNVALPLLLTGTTTDDATDAALACLGRMQLEHMAQRRPVNLSGGEQQRVALARAIVHQPALLLADEPTGNLDPDSAERALTLLRSVVGETRCALVLVTHSENAASICDRRIRLANGTLNAIDSDSATPLNTSSRQ